MVARMELTQLLKSVAGMLLACMPFALAADAIQAVDTGSYDFAVPTGALEYAGGEPGYWLMLAVAFPLLVGAAIAGLRSSFPQFVAWIFDE